MVSHHDDELVNVDQREEQLAFLRIEAAFRYYREYALKIMNFKRRHYEKVLPKHKTLLPHYETHFESMRRCIDANATFLENICDYSTQRMFYMYWPDGPQVTVSEKPTAQDMEKVIITLRQFVRDWSSEGAQERDACYGLLLQKLEQIFPDTSTRGDIKVLIPGSGLSRLAYEIFARGFYSQGNEFSHHMLIAGSFILNNVASASNYLVHPWVHHICNNKSRDDMLRSVSIPDVSPIEESMTNRLMQKGSFSMCAGDFLEVYSKPREKGAWNAVVTCFFIDTAHNIFQYVETIFSLLVVGGVWLNLGPLLYHFADQPNELSIELAYSDLRKVVEGFGFDIVEERQVECTYTANPKAMMYNVYRCMYFQAVKTDRLPQLTYLLHESVDACNAFKNKASGKQNTTHQQQPQGTSGSTGGVGVVPTPTTTGGGGGGQPGMPPVGSPSGPIPKIPQNIPVPPLFGATLPNMGGTPIAGMEAVGGVGFTSAQQSQAQLHAAAAHMHATLQLQQMQPGVGVPTTVPTGMSPTTTTTTTTSGGTATPVASQQVGGQPQTIPPQQVPDAQSAPPKPVEEDMDTDNASKKRARDNA